MVFAKSVRVDTLRTVAFGGISANYAVLGAAFTHRIRILKITNNTDGDLFIGFNALVTAPASDGTADGDIVPAGGFVLYDFTSNSEPTGSSLVFEVGTQVWVRQSTAPTSGSVYLTTIYARGE